MFEFDPYAVKKGAELKPEVAPRLVDATLRDLPRERERAFEALVYAALWGNRTDLSYNVSANIGRAPRLEDERANLLADDEPQVWQDLLAKMIGNPATGVKGVVRYTDLNKWERCRADHALLVVRHAGRFYLLDDSTDELLDGNLANDYRPILSFGEGKWLHGLPAARQPAIYLSRNELSSPRVSGVVR